MDSASHMRKPDIKLQRKASKVALAAAEGGMKIALKYFRKLKNVSIKEGAGLVSEADKESELFIMKTVHKAFSSHRLLGEEGGYAAGVGGKGEPLWVVDTL